MTVRFRVVRGAFAGWTAYDGDAEMFTARMYYGADEVLRMFVDRVEERLDEGNVVLLAVTDEGFDAIVCDRSVMGS